MAADAVPPLDEPRRIHIVAVGGAGMSAIARVLVEAGHDVSGSDAVAGPRLAPLAELGVHISVGHEAANVAGVDAVVVSTAVSEDNVEVIAARKAGTGVFTRREFLPALARQQPLLSVSGTHGKTTTSSMLAVALRGAGVSISWLIGADVPALGAAAAHHDGPYLVLEADESDGSFLAEPRAGALVTNLESDHLEFWGDWEALRMAFVDFVAKTAGPVVLCADDPGSAGLLESAGRDDVITYGTTEDSDVRMVGLSEDRHGSHFDIVTVESTHRVSLPMPGRHNALNATGAIALVGALGHDVPAAIAALGSHSGVHRRFETRGISAGVEVLDDYAHLPTEVEATLGAAKSRASGRVVAVFQPHRYSRTQSLGTSFGGSFAAADVVVITEIFPAGEQPRPGVSGRVVHEAIESRHPGEVHWAETLQDAVELLLELLGPGDTLVTVGAGDVREVGDLVLGGLEQREALSDEDPL